MKAALLANAQPGPMTLPAEDAPRPADVPTRLADYVELTKPRIATMSLITVAVGYLAAASDVFSASAVWGLLHTLFGAGLVAGGAAALNHWMERDIDRHMRRTRNRPLPAGRLSPPEVLAFGSVMGLAGVGHLLYWVNAAAAAAAAATFLIYVFVYTPLKRASWTNTLVGAVPGALPPVIGWCGAGGELGPAVTVLFAVLFLWQLPHFFAIAWMHRGEYAAAGLRMLPGVDPSGRLTAWASVAGCVGLIAVGVAAFFTAVGGWVFLIASLALGGFFLARALRFLRGRTDAAARKLLFASLIHLPVVLMTLLIDRLLA